MDEDFKIDLIYPVEAGVEHHKEAGQRSLARNLFLGELSHKSSLSTPPLGLLRIATATPKIIDGRPTSLRIFDDVVEPFSPSQWDMVEKPDVVGISCTTAASDRAAYLVWEATRRGIAIVLGGPHTTVAIEDSLGTGAAVVKGPGELAWQEVLGAVNSGTLENRLYEGANERVLEGVTLPSREFFSIGDYYSINVLSAGEGCPYGCPFCSTNMVKGSYEGRELSDVLPEIDQFRVEDGMVIITDDNFFMHPNVRQIIQRLGERELEWFATVSTRFTEKNIDLIELAGKNGCRILFLGIDRFDLPKNRGVDFDRLLAEIKANGIIPSVGFVFGLGNPTEQQLNSEMEEARRFIMRNTLPMVHLSNSVPYPGTQEFSLKGDRIVRPFSQWDTQGRTVYEPMHFSADTMDRCYFELCQEFYSLPNVLRRLSSLRSMRDVMEMFFYNFGRFQHIKKNFADLPSSK
ncbi:MAG: cobalamin-dependent protein [Nitrospirota bacterium]